MTLFWIPGLSLKALYLWPPGPEKLWFESSLGLMASFQAASNESGERGKGRDGQRSRGEGQGHRDGNSMSGSWQRIATSMASAWQRIQRIATSMASAWQRIG